ncbi:hypothetical protein B0H34DRAFT_522786 [Crassisporium funariophilum]|nr:hypothetical protein B0H34DRAFT_522786 [Crassisporium funariophilum]
MLLNTPSSLFLFALTIFQVGFHGVSARPQFSTGTPVTRRALPANVTELRTNAARMAAGLGPFKPKNFRDATRVEARVAATSPLPVLTGRIRVIRDGDNFGWIDKNYGTGSSTGMFTVTGASGSGNHLSISFSPSATPFFINVISPGTFPQLGYAGNNLFVTGSAGSYNFMTRTNPTAPGSGPSPVGNGMSSQGYPNSESSIWTYDSSNGRLGVKWVNSDGSIITPNFYYIPSLDTVVISAKTSGLPSGYDQVFLRFV